MRKGFLVLGIMVALFVLGMFGLILSGNGVLASESRIVVDHELSGPIWLNPLKYGISNAVRGGVSVQTLILLMLFPLTAAFVAFSRQVVGLNGFGIFIPALVSMAFMSTGILAGVVLFLAIILAGVVGRFLLKKVKLPYLPRMAVLIWLIVMAVLGLLISSPSLGVERLVNLGIFPILLFVMLAESNIEAQITRTWQTAALMTTETLVIAIISSLIMGGSQIQSWVLSNPELFVIFVLVADWMIGKYKGLRLLEIYRFRKIIKFK